MTLLLPAQWAFGNSKQCISAPYIRFGSFYTRIRNCAWRVVTWNTIILTPFAPAHYTFCLHATHGWKFVPRACASIWLLPKIVWNRFQLSSHLMKTWEKIGKSLIINYSIKNIKLKYFQIRLENGWFKLYWETILLIKAVCIDENIIIIFTNNRRKS